MKLAIPFLIFLSSCSIVTISTGSNSNSLASPQTYGANPVIHNTGTEKGEISGIIFNSEGKPLENVSVTLLQEGQIIKVTQSKLNGEFNIPELDHGIYSLEINSGGYVTQVIEKIIVNDFQKNSFDEISLCMGQSTYYKPIIYLYPEEKTQINVSMDYAGNLTFTYPKYPIAGWNVTAMPDGTLWDVSGKEFYALFWEGEPERQIIPTTGFVIAGNETVSFLEEKLAELGLNRREANEFIMFWMPQMENNAFNFIHFASDEYEKLSKLIITPQPETIIRVMMLTKPLKSKIEMPLQDISPLRVERKGYTVVEWGGSIIMSPIQG